MSAPLLSESQVGRTLASLDGSERVLLDQLFELAPEAIVLADLRSRVIRTNAEFTRLFGYTADEARGHSLDDLLAPAELRGEAEGATAVVAGGGHVAFESVRRRKDGSLVHVSVLGSPIYILGQEVAVLGIYRDITQLTRSLQALRASERQFASTFRSTPGPATISTIAEGRLLEVNDAFVALSGIPREEAIGAKCFDVLPGVTGWAQGRGFKSLWRLCKNVIPTDYDTAPRGVLIGCGWSQWPVFNRSGTRDGEEAGVIQGESPRWKSPRDNLAKGAAKAQPGV